MDATRCLRDEHRLILEVLDCFETALHGAHRSGAVSREAFGPFVEFFQGFADRCHHCKEEDRLFPCLERQGLPRDGGPIGVMLHEHRVARSLVKAMADSLQAAAGGDPASKRTVLDQGWKFLDLMRSHIAKEDHCLFNMADRMIRGDDLADLTRAYRSAESEPGYCERLSRCRSLAGELAQRYARDTA